MITLRDKLFRQSPPPPLTLLAHREYSKPFCILGTILRICSVVVDDELLKSSFNYFIGVLQCPNIRHIRAQT